MAILASFESAKRIERRRALAAAGHSLDQIHEWLSGDGNLLYSRKGEFRAVKDSCFSCFEKASLWLRGYTQCPVDRAAGYIQYLSTRAPCHLERKFTAIQQALGPNGASGALSALHTAVTAAITRAGAVKNEKRRAAAAEAPEPAEPPPASPPAAARRVPRQDGLDQFRVLPDGAGLLDPDDGPVPRPGSASPEASTVRDRSPEQRGASAPISIPGSGRERDRSGSTASSNASGPEGAHLVSSSAEACKPAKDPKTRNMGKFNKMMAKLDADSPDRELIEDLRKAVSFSFSNKKEFKSHVVACLRGIKRDIEEFRIRLVKFYNILAKEMNALEVADLPNEWFVNLDVKTTFPTRIVEFLFAARGVSHAELANKVQEARSKILSFDRWFQDTLKQMPSGDIYNRVFDGNIRELAKRLGECILVVSDYFPAVAAAAPAALEPPPISIDGEVGGTDSNVFRMPDLTENYFRAQALADSAPALAQKAPDKTSRTTADRYARRVRF